MAENIWGTDILKSLQQSTPRNPYADDAFIRNRQEGIAREEPVTPGLLSTIGDYYTNVTEYPYGEAFDRFKFLLGPSTEAVYDPMDFSDIIRERSLLPPEAIQKSIETKKVNPRTGKTTAGSITPTDLTGPSNEAYAEAMRSTAGIMAPTDSRVEPLIGNDSSTGAYTATDGISGRTGRVLSEMKKTNMVKRILTSVDKWEGGYQNKKTDGGNWTGGAVNKGTLVGTNRGVTPKSLAKHLNIDRSKITKQMIKDVTRKQANDIFLDQYLGPLGVLDMPYKVQKVLGNLSILRPAAITKARKANVKTAKEAMNVIVDSYAEIPNKGPRYRKYIKGWINRSRDAAGLSKLKNLAHIYKTYPQLMDDDTYYKLSGDNIKLSLSGGF